MEDLQTSQRDSSARHSRPGIARLLLFLGVGTALFILVSNASAEECMRSCSSGRKVCRMEAKTAGRACRAACKENGLTRECVQVCRDAYRGARTACKAALAGCQPECPPSDDGAHACVQSCGSVGHGCFRSLLEQGKDCVRSCKADGQSGFGACLLSCAGELNLGDGSCGDIVDTCRDDCEPLPPFPDPDPSLECAAACVESTSPCFEAAQPAFTTCSRDCLDAGWTGFLPCVQGCTDALCACALDVQMCLADCGESPAGHIDLPAGVFCSAPGSRGGAFVDAEAGASLFR